MNEEKFICKKCSSIIKKTDYDYKDYYLFKGLKCSGFCEECLKNNTLLELKID